MKKLFVSQPMRDKSKKEIKLHRNIALINTIRKTGENIQLINSWINQDPPESVKNAGLWYLGKSLITLAKADIVYFCKGWQDYRGCKCEYTAALEYGLEIIMEEYL